MCALVFVSMLKLVLFLPACSTPEGSGPSRYNSSMDAPRTNSFYSAPPPVSPGRKSTLLAICRQLPPSMQRTEWCLDDYIITDKLYKGYASMGKQKTVLDNTSRYCMLSCCPACSY